MGMKSIQTDWRLSQAVK